MVIRAVAALFALWIAVPAWAAQVQLVVPYRTLEVGQQGQADLMIVNGSTSTVPDLPVEDGLDVSFLGQRTDRRMMYGSKTTIRSFTYSVRALQEGTFTIGPATIVVDGQPMTTESVEIEVTPPPAVVAEGLVAYAMISPESAWEGQVALYTYGLRSKLEILRTGWLTLPTSRLVRPRDGSPMRTQYELEDPTGDILVDETTEPFVVTAGTDLDLEPGILQVEVPDPDARPGRMRLFQPTEIRTLQTNALHLDVRPLPPAPPGFSGLVGDFVFSGTVDETKAAVGESIEWIVTVRGDGSLEGFDLPPAEDRPDVRFYDGSPVVQAEIRDGYRAFGQYKRVIVPTEAGTLDLPALSVITFSPSEGRYVTQEIAVPPLDVVPGREGGGDMESFAPVLAVRPPETEQVVDVYPVIPSGRATSPFVAPWLLAGAALAFGVGAFTLLADARDAWRKRHPEVEAPVHKVRDLDPLTALDETLREALAKRLDVAPERLDRHAADALPEAIAGRVADTLRALERARFAGETPGPDLAERVQTLVHDLEKAA